MTLPDPLSIPKPGTHAYRLVAALVAAWGQPVRSADLIEACYGPARLPEAPLEVIGQAVHRLRPKLAAAGWDLRGVIGCRGGYYLVPLDTPGSPCDTAPTDHLTERTDR